MKVKPWTFFGQYRECVGNADDGTIIGTVIGVPSIEEETARRELANERMDDEGKEGHDGGITVLRALQTGNDWSIRSRDEQGRGNAVIRHINEPR